MLIFAQPYRILLIINIMETRKILLAVDLQKDFIDGSLTVPEAWKVIPVINEVKRHFDLVCFTLDWHPVDHCSFKANGGIWPAHCVQHTAGASLPDSVFEGLEKERIRFILKGMDSSKEEYGALSEIKAGEQDCFKAGDEVVVCGIAAEYCILNTLTNVFNFSKELGFTVKVYLPGTAKFESYDTLLEYMDANGIGQYLPPEEK